MDTQKLFDTIESLKDQYIEFLKDIVKIESPTDYKKGVDEVGEYFIKKAKEQGFSVEVSKQEGSGNAVCITMNENSKGKLFCISGHMDTVHPLGFFGENPVYVKDNELHGPGIEDCKGGIVLGFMVMDALKQNGYTDRPVRLLLQSDEENSSATSNKATINYICEKAKDAEYFLNLEPSTMKNAIMQRKGIAKYEFTVNGQAAHASQCALKGASAIKEAAYKIIEIEKNQDNDAITMSCGIIEGGTAINTVPPECKFRLDVRYADDEQLKRVEEIVNSVAEKSFVEGTSCTARRLSLRVAMPRTDKNVAFLDKVNVIYKKHNFGELKYEKRGGGSDAADVTAAGITVMDGFGVHGGGGHTINEMIYLDDFTECAKRIAAIITEI